MLDEWEVCLYTIHPPLYGGIDEVTNEEGRDLRVIAASLVT